MTTNEQNIFDKTNYWLNQVEGSAVNLATTVVPWLTPIAPMVMTFNHATAILGHWVWAVPVAATVELLGFATVSTLVRFWMFNKRNKAEYKKAPTWVAGLAFVFYLMVVISTNVLLDMWPDVREVEITVKALFTLQTIPGAVIVVIRSAHRDLLKQIEDERSRPKANDTPNSSPKKKAVRNKPRTFASLTNEEKEQIKNGETKQLATVFGVSERAIQKWKLKA